MVEKKGEGRLEGGRKKLTGLSVEEKYFVDVERGKGDVGEQTKGWGKLWGVQK